MYIHYCHCMCSPFSDHFILQPSPRIIDRDGRYFRGLVVQLLLFTDEEMDPEKLGDLPMVT